jgi:NADH:ubiquinone oxidoreductase subunit 5 (subunit L)/multisubunit Na+/H+ antiporter MnhA subunit
VVVDGAAPAALVVHRASWGPTPRSARRTRRSFQVGDAALLVATFLTLVSVGEIDLRSPEGGRGACGGVDPGDRRQRLPVVAVLLTVASISRSALVALHGWRSPTIAGVGAAARGGSQRPAGVLLVRLAPVSGSSAVAMHFVFVAGAVTVCYPTSVMLVRT